MSGTEFVFQNSEDDEVLDLKEGPPSFSIPTKPIGLSAILSPREDMNLLVNTKKVSSDVMSLRSQSILSDESSETETESEVEAESQSGDDSVSEERPRAIPVDTSKIRAQMHSEMSEKKELLYQFDRLETKGVKLPKKFTLESDLYEMRSEYHRLVREREVDASIRFQRNMVMYTVSAIEYLNNRFDPFDLVLDGWSESFHENIIDYDDIFEELHEKYKNKGTKMPPEVRLMMNIAGSAFMTHVTNSMFKRSQLPGVEDVLRSNPGLMKQFQQAAVQQVRKPQGGGGGGIFGMLGNLLGGGGGGAAPSMPPKGGQQSKMSGPSDIDNIIQQIHGEITTAPPSNRFETMSVTDTEITDLLEEAPDISGLLSIPAKRQPARNSNTKAGPKRNTLQI